MYAGVDKAFLELDQIKNIPGQCPPKIRLIDEANSPDRKNRRRDGDDERSPKTLSEADSQGDQEQRQHEGGARNHGGPKEEALERLISTTRHAGLLTDVSLQLQVRGRTVAKPVRGAR